MNNDPLDRTAITVKPIMQQAGGVLLHQQQPFLTIASDGHVLEHNAAFSSLAGIAHTGSQPLHWLDHLTPRDIQVAEHDRLAQVLRNGEAFSYERQLRLGDGSEIPVEVKMHGQHPGNGGAACIHIFVTDLRGRRALELSLQESEQRFRAVLDNALDAAYRRDLLTGQYDYISPVISTVMGIGPEELRTMSMEVLLTRVHPDDHHLVMAGIEAGWEHQKGRVEYRFRDDEGNYRWIADSFYVQLDEDGEPLYRGGIVRDISQWRMHDEALRNNQHMLRVALEAASMGTWRYTVRTDTWELGERARELYGLTVAGPLTGSGHFLEVLHPDDVGPMRLAMAQALDPTGEGHYHIQYRVRNGTDGWRWLNVWAQVEFSGIGEERTAVQMVGASRDITASRNAEEELRISEERYRLVVEAQTELVCRFRMDGTILFTNHAYARAVGCSSTEQVVGRQFWDMVPQADQELIQYKLSLLTPEEPTVEIENRFMAKDGERWTHWTNRALRFGEDGRVLEAQSTGIDITERKRSEQLVNAQKRALEMVVQGEPLEKTLNFIAQVVELQSPRKAFCTIMLVDELGVFHPGASPSLPMSYLQAFDGFIARPGVGTCSIAACTGERVITEDITTDPAWDGLRDGLMAFGPRAVWSQPVKARDGSVIGTFATYYTTPGTPDAQEIRVVELLARTVALAMEHRRALDALLESDRRKDEFLATLAHELRNPLAPIRTGLELMELVQHDPVTMAATRDMMERQTLQMVHMIDDLLDVSRISRDKLELRLQSATLSEIIRNSVDTSRPHINQQQQQLEVELPGEPIVLHADPSRLAQVFANLLNNASKFTPPGGNIRLQARIDKGQLLVEVEDSGIGIPVEMQEKIFEMFTQMERPDGQLKKGLGIGLTLARRLVAMHGGHIEASSDGPGTGSLFRVVLPLSGGPLQV
jgi:PAS domain S-box-containing protein